MIAQFELSIDSNGKPCISFRHHDKDKSLEQKILKVFLDGVKEKGCELVATSGYSQTACFPLLGTVDSWDNYEIQIKQKE